MLGPRLTETVEENAATAGAGPIVDFLPAIWTLARVAEHRPAMRTVGWWWQLEFLLPSRLPDELPVGLETALVVLGVEGFVEGAADLLREFGVA